MAKIKQERVQKLEAPWAPAGDAMPMYISFGNCWNVGKNRF